MQIVVYGVVVAWASHHSDSVLVALIPHISRSGLIRTFIQNEQNHDWILSEENSPNNLRGIWPNQWLGNLKFFIFILKILRKKVFPENFRNFFSGKLRKKILVCWPYIFHDIYSCSSWNFWGLKDLCGFKNFWGLKDLCGFKNFWRIKNFCGFTNFWRLNNYCGLKIFEG